MRLLGWRSEAMLSRYGASAADHRASRRPGGCAGVTGYEDRVRRDAGCRWCWCAASGVTRLRGSSARRQGEAGSWSHKERNRRCHCDPPPTLPAGAELDGLVAQAWRKMRYDGRAPVVVFR